MRRLFARELILTSVSIPLSASTWVVICLSFRCPKPRSSCFLSLSAAIVTVRCLAAAGLVTIPISQVMAWRNVNWMAGSDYDGGAIPTTPLSCRPSPKRIQLEKSTGDGSRCESERMQPEWIRDDRFASLPVAKRTIPRSAGRAAPLGRLGKDGEEAFRAKQSCGRSAIARSWYGHERASRRAGGALRISSVDGLKERLGQPRASARYLLAHPTLRVAS